MNAWSPLNLPKGKMDAAGPGEPQDPVLTSQAPGLAKGRRPRNPTSLRLSFPRPSQGSSVSCLTSPLPIRKFAPGMVSCVHAWHMTAVLLKICKHYTTRGWERGTQADRTCVPWAVSLQSLSSLRLSRVPHLLTLPCPASQGRKSRASVRWQLD